MTRLILLGAVLLVSASAASGYLKYDDYAGKPYTVTYDKRSLMLNGNRGLFASVGIHYPVSRLPVPDPHEIHCGKKTALYARPMGRRVQEGEK